MIGKFVMLKIVLGFVVFAALSLFVIFKAGDKVDMGGEKHGAEAVHVPEDSKPVAAPASAADTPTAPAAPAAAPAPAGK
jgi:predicted lipid-binding transport protein (Tim44 family)